MPKFDYTSPIKAITAGTVAEFETDDRNAIRKAVNHLREIGYGMLEVPAKVSVDDSGSYQILECRLSIAAIEDLTDEEIWGRINEDIAEQYERLTISQQAWKISGNEPPSKR